MPQMSPMWWTTMLMWTILCLTMMMSINYFNYNSKINNYTNKMNTKMNWKW